MQVKGIVGISLFYYSALLFPSLSKEFSLLILNQNALFLQSQLEKICFKRRVKKLSLPHFCVGKPSSS